MQHPSTKRHTIVAEPDVCDVDKIFFLSVAKTVYTARVYERHEFLHRHGDFC